MATATARSRVPVGSAQWILSERRQANQFVDDEVEEFGYSVRNELDWLNEHMHDVLASQQLSVVDIFKTPGKLRGKTPRTARKRTALEIRMPLTDVFAPQPQAITSPTQIGLFARQLPQFHVAEDAEETQPNTQSTAEVIRASYQKPVVGLGKENTDSGYHGITEDEMDIVPSKALGIKPLPQCSPTCSSPKKNQPSRQQHSASDIEEPQSFVSAKENLATKNPSVAEYRDKDHEHAQDENLGALLVQAQNAAQALGAQHASRDARSVQSTALEPDSGHVDEDENASGSEGSSPVKPVVRKSSLTFASLPAREPLATRVSRTSHLDQIKARSSHFGRMTGGKSIGGTQHFQANSSHEMETTDGSEISRKESEAMKQHNKTSTQQLHDRITMLGQSKELFSKSIASGNLSSQPSSQHNASDLAENFENYGEEVFIDRAANQSNPVNHKISFPEDNEVDDGDWIAPIKPGVISVSSMSQQRVGKRPAAEMSGEIDSDETNTRRPRKSLTRPAFSHMKSVSTTAIPSPARSQGTHDGTHIKTISVSNPPMQSIVSTTPVGSPTSRKFAENPLSASKAKLYSVLKSAKGIFASSAGISASAKLEALSQAPTRVTKQHESALQGSWEELLSPLRNAHPPLRYKDIEPAVAQVERSVEIDNPSKAPELRRTRSSAERERRMEREMKEQQRVDSELERAREKERHKATLYQLKQKQSKESVLETRPANPSVDDMPPPPPKSFLPTTQASKPKEIRRPAKPTKETLRAKPAPMSIKVGVASQRLQPTTATLSASLHDSLPPPATKGASVKAPSSVASSTSNFKTSVSSQNARPKALEVAAKKKEQEERAAARKAEQKRELERKRAEKLEQDRLMDQQRKAAEQQRVQEAKKAAARQVEAKKLEQQRKEAQRAPSRQVNDLAHAMQNDKSHTGPVHPRGDLGAAKPISRLNTIQDMPRVLPQMNPAGPAKRPRPADTEEEEEEQQQQQQQQRPQPQRIGPSYQQLEAGKRRKTIDDEEDDGENQGNQNQSRQSIKAPPMRPSTHHKVDHSATFSGLLKSNISKQQHNPFAHGYIPAVTQSSHASMHKATVTAQHFLQHSKAAHPSDLAQISNGKIPFAQNPNPPAPSTHSQHSTHKTPVRTIGFAGPKSALKSPSQFTPGETIDLPEIATDSEDSDTDEGGFSAPSWVDSPNLRELLSAQQLIDPESVFGPIGQINMEEVFKNKDRHKRFRDRTSSANWSGTDKLTEEDKRKDREGRERLMRDGGWTYGPGL